MTTQVSNDAFRVIFPRYADLLKENPVPHNESIEQFLRDQLPRKVEMVRSMESCFNAFLTHFTNIILKRPQHSHLIHSLLLKANDKIEKYFQSLSLTAHKLDTNTIKNRIPGADPQELRKDFRAKLESMGELLKQKFFSGGILARECEEQITMKLYTLFEIYYFLKNDPVAMAAKFRINEQDVLWSVSRNDEPSDLSTLISLDPNFLQNIQETVSKRCRPFLGRRQLLQSKVRQALREGESRVGANLNLFLDSLLSKERGRVGRQLSASLGRELRSLEEGEGEQEVKQMISEVQSLKREFGQIKNTTYFLDIMRGNFSQKYKMQIHRLQNVFYLTNLQKYLQDVSTFLEKVLSLEQRIIKNRKDYMRDFGGRVDIKISDLISFYDQRTASLSLSEVILHQFQQLQSALYGVVMRKETAPLADDNKRREEREQRQAERKRQMQIKAEEERQKRMLEKAKLQEMRIKEQERIKAAKLQRDEKDRQRREETEKLQQARRIQLQKKRQEKAKKDEEQRKLKEEEQKKRDQQRKRKEADEKAKREELIAKKSQEEERKRRQKEEDNRKREQERKKILEKEEEEKRKREAELKQKKEKEEQDRLRRENQRKSEQQKLKRQKQERQRQARKKEDERLRLQKQKKDKQLKEAEQRKREQEKKKQQRQQKEREQRQLQERRKQQQRKQKQKKDKDEKDRKERQRKEKEAEDKRKQEERKKEEQKQKLEKEKKEKELKEQKQRQRKAEQDRIAREKEEKRKKEEEQKAKREKQKKDRQEKERQQRQKAEQERKQKQRLQKEKAEKERQLRQQQEKKKKADRQRLQKEKREAEEKARMERQQLQKQERQRKLHLQLKKKEEQQAKAKKPEPKKSSGINYGDFDDILDQDLEEMEKAGKIQSSDIQSGIKQYDDYGDDFDEEPSKGVEIAPKELISLADIKCLNDYMKGTSYARKNKVNADHLNKPDKYLQVFEEFVQNRKLFFFDSAISKAVMDLGAELVNPDTPEEDLQMNIETIKQEMLKGYDEILPGEQMFPATRYIYPFSFANDFNIKIIQMIPAHAYFKVIFDQPFPKDEALTQKFQSIIEGLLHLFQLDGEPTLQEFYVGEQSKLVLDTFDKELPCLLILYAMHYERTNPKEILINQYTIERFFYTTNIIDPLYSAIKEEEKIEQFYNKLAEKYSNNDKIKIHNIVVNSSDEEYSQQLTHSALAIKEEFKKGKMSTTLACFAIQIQEEGELADKVVVYMSIDRASPKSTINYFLISKDSEQQENATVIFELISQDDEDFQITVFTDFTRHNCLSAYSDWSLPLWAHSIGKRKMSSLQVMRAMAYSMTPYFLAFKQMD